MQPSLWWNIAPAVTGYCVVLHGDKFVEEVYICIYVYTHTYAQIYVAMFTFSICMQCNWN